MQNTLNDIKRVSGEQGEISRDIRRLTIGAMADDVSALEPDEERALHHSSQLVSQGGTDLVWQASL